MEGNKESYGEAKLEGMFEAYNLADEAIGRLRRSLENVWSIHDQDDSLNKSSQEYRERLEFAISTLSVLRENFGDEFDMSISEIKSGLGNYGNEYELRSS